MDSNFPCICCHKSLNRIGGTRRRSFSLTSQFVQENLFLMNYFVEVANVQGFSPSNRICRPCFQRAQRYVRVKHEDGQIIKEEPAVELYHIEEHDCQAVADAVKPEAGFPVNQVDFLKSNILSDDTEENQHHDSDVLRQETSAYARLECQPIKQESTTHDESQNILLEYHGSDSGKQETPTYNDRAVQANEPQMMSISGYTRVPLNTHLCIFESCSNRNLQRINVDTRAAFLQKKSFYIPHGARVCEMHEEHLFAAAWQEFVELDTRRIYTEFTSQHISDMLNLLRVFNI